MLNLNDLDTDDIPGITRVKGNNLAQAGAICLESQGHQQGVRLMVQGYVSNSYPLSWTPANNQARRTWNDPNEATEAGAIGIAVLVAIREIGYTVIARSWQGTGFDYWLGNADTANISTIEREVTTKLRDILQDDNFVVRGSLEVSGIRTGNDHQIRARMQQKLQQIDQSDTWGLPVYVIVVEFRRPLAEIEEKRNGQS